MENSINNEVTQAVLGLLAGNGIKVFHGKSFRAMDMAEMGGPALSFPNDYHHVATVHVPDSEFWRVFELTNSIHCGWWENGAVEANLDSPAFVTRDGVTGTRSTSIGDHIQLSDGRVFKCQTIGWKEVK